MTRRAHQEGAALLTVLLLTATLAVLAVAMTEVVTRALARASAAAARDQAFWALYGLESAALDYLERQGAEIDRPDAPLFAAPVVLPFEGGRATITFRERSNCFNVNDLVDFGGDGTVADEAAAARFAALVTALGGNRSGGQQLAARITDFIDDDRRAQAGGAEDYDYARHEVPYRTPGSILVSPSEMRAIAGFSRDVYRSLLPYLCTPPLDGPQVLNVNTLTPAHAPLLAAVTDNAVNPALAARVIAQRPEAGYDEAADFLAHPLLQGVDLPSDTPTFVGTQSRLIAMEMVLESEIGRIRQESVLFRDRGRVAVLERRVGERLP